MNSSLPALLPRLVRLVTPPAADADATLLDRFLGARDEGAFAALMRRHGPMVLGVGCRLLGDRHAAEDVFQATFLVLAQQAAQVRQRGSLAAWLYGVARRLALKARKRLPARLEGLDRPDPRPGPVAELTTREALGVLDEELHRLSSRQGLAVALCCLEGLSQEEVARRLGWTAGEVKGQLERGRRRLRQRLARRGLTWSAALGAATLAQTAMAGPVAAGVMAWVRGGMAAEAIGAPARALAAGAMRGGGTMKGVVAAVVLSLGLLAVGGAVGWPTAAPAVRPAVGPPRPAADLFGDALPPGAVARMGSVRLRHARMSDYVWLADSKTVLSSGGDRVLRYWDAGSGKEIRNVALQGKQGPGRAVTLSPDGKVLAAVERGSLHVWEVETGKHLKTLPAPKAGHTFLWFSPDGKTLAVGRQDVRVSLWDWRAGKEREITLAHKPGRERITRSDSSTHGGFSPDGKWFVTAVDSQEPLGVFEVATGREMCRIDCGPVTSAVSPDSKTIAVSSYLNAKGGQSALIRLIDLATGQQKKQFTLDIEGTFFNLAFSPDGKKLACGFSGSSLVLEIATGRVLYRLPDRPGWLSFSPDGKTLAASMGRHLRFWDAATGRERHPWPNGFGHSPVLAVSPDGRLLASGDWTAQAISVWDTSNGRLLHRLPLKGTKRYARHVAFLADGKTLIACQGLGYVQFWDATNGQERRAFQLTDPSEPRRRPFFYTLHVTAEGKSLTTLERCVFEKDEITRVGVWDLDTGKLRHEQTLTGVQARATLSADGTAVALSLKQGLTVFDVATGGIRLRASVEAASPPLVSPDGRLLAVLDLKGTVRVYEALTGKFVTAVAMPKPHHLALAADNRTLALCDGRSLRVCDLASGQERQRFALPAAATALLLSPDGRRAFTTLEDGTALVWALSPAAPPATPPTDKELAAWWAALSSADAGKAYAAVWRLAEASAAADALRKHLRPVAVAETKKIQKLIEDLDDDAFAVRERATKQLAAHGGDITSLLRDAMAQRPPLELRQRLDRLLKDAHRKGPSPEGLRSLRAIQALELNASAGARRLLTELAAGAPLAERTRQARAALARLAPAHK